MGKLRLLIWMALGLGATLQAAKIPAGTNVVIRLGQTISSATAKSGDTWSGTLVERIVVNGRTLARKDATVVGKVVEAKASGRMSGKAFLALQITSIGGIPVITDSVTSEGQGHAGRNAKAIGGTAAAGAVIGALAGGGKGAAIGAGAGAGVGATGAAVTGKKDIKFPVETVLEFTIQ